MELLPAARTLASKILAMPPLVTRMMLVKEVIAALGDIRKTLGTTILIVEQNVRAALSIADRAYVMRLGQIVMEEAEPARLVEDEKLRRAYIA